jgi:hypothetical protein
MVLSRESSRGRLDLAHECAQVGDLSDLFALPPAGEAAQVPTLEQRRVLSEQLRGSSPLAQMTGLFAEVLSRSSNTQQTHVP